MQLSIQTKYIIFINNALNLIVESCIIETILKPHFHIQPEFMKILTEYLKSFSKTILISILFLFPAINLYSQPSSNLTSSEIKLALKKLNRVGTVLYIAAHPDDENTAVLSYYSSGKLLRTGYLSLTRGDGGQNLIGPEQADLLSIIRTQELIAARKIDGAEQFFTRAIDFGYTKSSEETFEFWGKEKILYDVVWVIRKFKPDVIITRFPITGEGRHGQHTASAILALEAFNKANDPSVFPDQLEELETWQPKRIFWNAWTPALKSMGLDTSDVPYANLGAYNPLLGMSYTEISALSRTMHKSQGFGDDGWRANYLNYFYLMDGEPISNRNILEGIDISWNRFEKGEKVGKQVEEVIKKYDEENPGLIIPDLINIYKEIQSLENEHWKEIKSREVKKIIFSCAGIWAEAIAEDFIYTPGSSIKVKTGIVNRSEFPAQLENISITFSENDQNTEKDLRKGEFIENEFSLKLPDEIEFTNPYWLKNEHEYGIYNVDNRELTGLAETDQPLNAVFTLDFADIKLELETPVYFRKVDPVKGEIYRPVEIVPPATVSFENELYLLKSNSEEEIRVKIKAHKNNVSGILKIIAPEGWNVDPAEQKFSVDQKGDEMFLKVMLSSEKQEDVSGLKSELLIDGKTYSKSFATIEYDHFPVQTVLPEAETKVVKLNLKNGVDKRIGYIEGSGDKVPDILSDLGYDVDLLTDEEIESSDLSDYDVIISGIRAYNTRERIKLYQDKLMNYVNGGGTYIVQYNTSHRLITNPSPFELELSRDRVTEEDSNVEILKPDHPLFSMPNRITSADFDNWIQERGLYFPGEWSDKFTPLLSMNDDGESAKTGSLLYAEYGNGIFIYTGISFFRQLPAGVPGAFRLFENLISAKQKND